MIKITPDRQSDPEQKGQEFSYYVCDTLLNISAVPKEEVVINMVDNAILTHGTNLDISVSTVSLKLQEKDDFCKYIINVLNKNHLQTGQPYFIRDSILI